MGTLLSRSLIDIGEIFRVFRVYFRSHLYFNGHRWRGANVCGGCYISDVHVRYCVLFCYTVCIEKMHIYIYYSYSMCVHLYTHSKLKRALRGILRRWVSQSHVTSAGIQGSVRLVPPPMYLWVCGSERVLPCCLSVRPSLFLMEITSSLTTRKKWGLALWVLRLRHRALRNR